MKAPVVGVLLSCISAAIGGIVEKRASGGYVQNVSGTASFTMYSGCNSPGKYSISSPDFSLSLNPCINNSMLYIYVYIIGFFLACGVAGSGYTAALNQLSFGSAPGLGPGDACGRCFAVTASADPYSPSFTGPFKTIVVKVTDLCPVSGNEQWCGQSTSNGSNQFGKSAQYAFLIKNI